MGKAGKGVGVGDQWIKQGDHVNLLDFENTLSFSGCCSGAIFMIASLQVSTEWCLFYKSTWFKFSSVLLHSMLMQDKFINS